MLHQQYEREGFCVLKSLLKPCVLREIRRKVLMPFSALIGHEATDADLFGLFNSNHADYLACAKIAHQVPAIHSLGLSEEILGIIQSELKMRFPVINTRPVLLFSAKGLAKHEFYWKAKAHQDRAIMTGSEEGVVVWVPLCEMESDLGYLQVVPGSHKTGLMSHVDDGPSRAISTTIPEESYLSVPMQIGDALFFSSNLIHRSGVNVSEKVRLTVSYRYDNLLNEEFIKSRFPLGFEYLMKPIK